MATPLHASRVKFILTDITLAMVLQGQGSQSARNLYNTQRAKQNLITDELIN